MRTKRVAAAVAGIAALALSASACGGTANQGLSSVSGAAAADWAPVTVDIWEGLSMDRPHTTGEYTPLGKADKPWNLCASFPHMKDAYWLAVDYGVAEQAKAAGVNLTVVEAGGYENLDTQIQQIEDCAQSADAVIIGAISYDGLNSTVERLTERGKPVIDVVNGMSSEKVTAKSLVSFAEMATKAAEWLAEEVGDEPVTVAWFPGPKGAGWAEAGESGFKQTIAGTSIEVVDTKWGDTGKEVQSQLIEDALAANPDIDYIVGTAVTAEAAGPILRDRNLQDQIGVVAYYFSSGTYQGIQTGSVAAAPSDSPVIQGRIAVDQAIRALQGDEFEVHVGPQIFVVDQENIATFDRSSSLAPDGWDPVFNVSARR